MLEKVYLTTCVKENVNLTPGDGKKDAVYLTCRKYESPNTDIPVLCITRAGIHKRPSLSFCEMTLKPLFYILFTNAIHRECQSCGGIFFSKRVIFLKIDSF